MPTSNDLLRRLAEVKGSRVKRVVEDTVGSLKRHVNLSLVDAEGKLLVPDLRGESVDHRFSGAPALLI
jgi:hypothetical protein